MSQAKERPILFGGPMVRAILSGQKKVTRRPIKHQPFDLSWSRRDHSFNYVSGRAANGDEVDGFWAYTTRSGGQWEAKCPYGQPGDRLWVRETLEVVAAWGVYYAASGPNSPEGYLDDNDIRGVDLLSRYGDQHDVNLARQIPSIHMPRWASRILLEITDVRVERLQDISEEQAEAEGVERDSDGWFDYQMPSTQCCPSAIESFRTLWSSINGSESWDTNPWVWVVEFKRVQP